MTGLVRISTGKAIQQFIEPRDSENRKVAVLIPFPKISSDLGHRKLRVSHQIPAESEVSRQNRATPPKSRCRTFLGPPRRTFLSHSQQAGGRAGGGCRGGLSWHFWVPKTDRATGRCRSYSHTSRATLCN